MTTRTFTEEQERIAQATGPPPGPPPSHARKNKNYQGQQAGQNKMKNQQVAHVTHGTQSSSQQTGQTVRTQQRANTVVAESSTSQTGHTAETQTGDFVSPRQGSQDNYNQNLKAGAKTTKCCIIQ